MHALRRSILHRQEPLSALLLENTQLLQNHDGSDRDFIISLYLGDFAGLIHGRNGVGAVVMMVGGTRLTETLEERDKV